MNLEEFIKEIAGISRQLSQKEHELYSLEKALGQKRQEVEQLIQETGICPLCGSTMDFSHFLEAVHA